MEQVQSVRKQISLTSGNRRFPVALLPHVLLAAVLILMFVVPHQRDADAPRLPFLVVLALVELLWLAGFIRERRKGILDLRTKSILFAIVFGILFLWELFTTVLGILDPVFYPGPEEVFDVYVQKWSLILTGLWQSLLKLLLGICLAMAASVVLGLIIGWIPSARKVFFPICKVLSPIPPVIYVTYVVALMPTFASASVAVVFLGVFWPTLLSVITSVGNVDKGIIVTARSMGVSNRTMMFRVILPYSLPAILANMTVMVSFSFMTLTAAEMIGSTAGLGFFVVKFASYAKYDHVICGIITIGIVVVILNKIIDLIRAKVVKWK